MFKLTVRAEVAAPDETVLYAEMAPFVENAALVERAGYTECTFCAKVTVFAERSPLTELAALAKDRIGTEYAAIREIAVFRELLHHAIVTLRTVQYAELVAFQRVQRGLRDKRCHTITHPAGTPTSDVRVLRCVPRFPHTRR